MTIVLNGLRQEVPGIKSESWLDGNPKIKYITDKDPRNRRIRGIVAHTHEGLSGNLLDGFGPNTTLDERLAMYQVSTDRYVSWDYTIDLNGDITWQNDPAVDCSWHAYPVNRLTLGFEMIQQVRKNAAGQMIAGDLYRGQIEKAVLMIDFLTAKLKIQRQIPWDTTLNRPDSRVLDRLKTSGGCGEDVVGVYGHRNITSQKPAGDPGDAIYLALKDAGYELFDYALEQDKTAWKARQQMLGMPASDCDGVALTKTVAALESHGHKFGLWVKRPSDDLFGA